MGAPKFTKAPLGATVVMFNEPDEPVLVQRACNTHEIVRDGARYRGDDAPWYCIRCKTVCANSFVRDLHCAEPGEHVFAMVCAKHGLEVVSPETSSRKPFNDRAGYVASKRSGFGGGHVVIYVAADAGICVTRGDRFAVSCETHNEIVSARTDPSARAFMKTPTEWCSGCGAASRAEKGGAP